MPNRINRAIKSTDVAPLYNSAQGRISIDTSPFPSTVASTLYRASPIDPALKPGTSPDGDFPYDLPVNTSATRQPSSGSVSFPTTLPDIKSVARFGQGDSDGYTGSSVSTSLPGLAALASVASAPTSNLRFVKTPRQSVLTTFGEMVIACINLQDPMESF